MSNKLMLKSVENALYDAADHTNYNRNNVFDGLVYYEVQNMLDIVFKDLNLSYKTIDVDFVSDNAHSEQEFDSLIVKYEINENETKIMKFSLPCNLNKASEIIFESLNAVEN